jgi:hypothetical protein
MICRSCDDNAPATRGHTDRSAPTSLAGSGSSTSARRANDEASHPICRVGASTFLNSLTLEGDGYFWPAFSADGSELLFDRNNEINAVHLDGSGFRRIVQNWTTTIKSPAVSPNGVDVAYQVYCDTGPSIWTTPLSTTTNPCEGRRVTPVGDLDSLRPAWGPNNLIAYARVEKGTNVASIAVVSRAGGSVPCVLTADHADDRNPSWSF